MRSLGVKTNLKKVENSLSLIGILEILLQMFFVLFRHSFYIGSLTV